jgi:phage terminase large subunit
MSAALAYQVEIWPDYQPRKAFHSFHERRQRWAALVCHRRAGKTVACVGELVGRAMATGKANARYAYIAPYYSQAKQVAWDYLKRMVLPLEAEVRESELSVKLPHNGAVIRLYGADNPDALRGIYLDGVVLDEYADTKPSLWGAVIRPLLTDRRGWAVFIGTPKGRNAFYEIVDHARNNDDWFDLTLKASSSGLLHPDELADAQRTMSEDQYNAEFECSFDAAIIGAYWGKEMRIALEEGRICDVAYDPAVPVETAWDIGYTDSVAIWFFQRVRGEKHFIDHYENNGHDVEHYASVLHGKGYKYAEHWLPHDARAKTFAAKGKSVIEQLIELGIKATIGPELSRQDGIQAARMILPACWFDRTRCMDGLEHLRQYRRQWDEDRKMFGPDPAKTPHNHTADAFRYAAIAMRDGDARPKPAPKPRFLNEMTLDELWQTTPKGRQRI